MKEPGNRKRKLTFKNLYISKVDLNNPKKSKISKTQQTPNTISVDIHEAPTSKSNPIESFPDFRPPNSQQSIDSLPCIIDDMSDYSPSVPLKVSKSSKTSKQITNCYKKSKISKTQQTPNIKTITVDIHEAPTSQITSN